MGRVLPVGAHIARPTEGPPPQLCRERPLAVGAPRGRGHELRRALGVVTMPVHVTGYAPAADPPLDQPLAVRARRYGRGAQQVATGPLQAVTIPVLVAAVTPAPAPLPGATGALADEARNGRLGVLLHSPPRHRPDYR